MYKCPHCNNETISLVSKVCAVRANPATCVACARKSFTPSIYFHAVFTLFLMGSWIGVILLMYYLSFSLAVMAYGFFFIVALFFTRVAPSLVDVDIANQIGWKLGKVFTRNK